MRDTFPTRGELLRMAVLCEGGLGGLAWVLGWLLEQPVWEEVIWNVADVGLGIAASFPLLLVFFLTLFCPLGPWESIRRFADEIIKPLFEPCGLLDLAFICLLAGIGEELLFRGLLQPLFISWVSFWPGLLLASFVFGLAHPITPAYVVLATLMGLYLGWAYLASGNLLVVIVAHALYDFVALVVVVGGGVRGQGSGVREEPE